MNNRSIIITLIVSLSVICVSLIVGMIILMNKDISFKLGFNLGSWKLELVDTIEEDGNNISNLDFNLYSTDVEIKESNTNNLKIEYYSNKEKDKVIKKENDKITIDEAENKIICVGICNSRKKVIVYVPSTYIGSYDIKTSSGDIKSSIDMIENEVNITSTSGDVNLKDTTNVNISTTSGSINIGNTNKANLYAISGDIKVKGKVNSADIKTTSGDIVVNEINKYLNFYTVSGSININTLNILDDSSISTTSGDIAIINNASNCYIEFSSISGDRRINKSDRKSDMILKVNTISGDISVN